MSALILLSHPLCLTLSIDYGHDSGVRVRVEFWVREVLGFGFWVWVQMGSHLLHFLHMNPLRAERHAQVTSPQKLMGRATLADTAELYTL